MIHQDDEFGVVDGNVDTMDNLGIAEGLANLLELNGCHGAKSCYVFLLRQVVCLLHRDTQSGRRLTFHRRSA